MSLELDDLIKEIAVKHGISIGKDDPVLMLHTVNKLLIEESQKAHQDIILNFRSELEHASAQWNDNANEKAEKILNAALISSKEMMSNLIQQSTEQAIKAIEEIMSNTLEELKEIKLKTKYYATTTLFITGTMIILMLFVGVFYLI